MNKPEVKRVLRYYFQALIKDRSIILFGEASAEIDDVVDKIYKDIHTIARAEAITVIAQIFNAEALDKLKG